MYISYTHHQEKAFKYPIPHYKMLSRLTTRQQRIVPQIFELYCILCYNVYTVRHLPKKPLLIIQNKTCQSITQRKEQTALIQRLDQNKLQTDNFYTQHEENNIPTFPEGDILILGIATYEYLSSNSFSSRIVSGSPQEPSDDRIKYNYAVTEK